MVMLFIVRRGLQVVIPSLWFVGGAAVDGFSAIKMTALGRPQFLVGVPLLLFAIQVDEWISGPLRTYGSHC